jgi:hypothetical protein
VALLVGPHGTCRHPRLPKLSERRKITQELADHLDQLHRTAASFLIQHRKCRLVKGRTGCQLCSTRVTKSFRKCVKLSKPDMQFQVTQAALRRTTQRRRNDVARVRSLASTSLNEQGWHPDLIEFQLADTERNEV